LKALYEPSEGARRSPYAVAEWGRLNHEHDRRPGVGVIMLHSPLGEGPGVRAPPDIEWCDIPAGAFLYGKDKQERKIPYSFKMSKYLVTYQQFQTFIDSGEFEALRYWKGFPKWYHPQKMDKQNNPYDNHPRDRVSWYQAVAFSRWLNEKYRKAGLIDEGVEIRLPTEQEWEYAARGTDERIYPYQGVFDPTKGNTSEATLLCNTDR
jgi:formylglycine-generating enzyme required for sulfatase activity